MHSKFLSNLMDIEFGTNDLINKILCFSMHAKFTLNFMSLGFTQTQNILLVINLVHAKSMFKFMNIEFIFNLRININ
jgi:hypothetical protein